MKKYGCRLKTIEYRALDQKARGRRPNLFWVCVEIEVEDCEAVDKKFVQIDLGIDNDDDNVHDTDILPAHHIGKPRDENRPGANRLHELTQRPLIAYFKDYKTIEIVMSRLHKLKGSSEGVSREYPQEVNGARKFFWPKLKGLKRNCENVAIRYLAKCV